METKQQTSKDEKQARRYIAISRGPPRGQKHQKAKDKDASPKQGTCLSFISPSPSRDQIPSKTTPRKRSSHHESSKKLSWHRRMENPRRPISLCFRFLHSGLILSWSPISHVFSPTVDSGLELDGFSAHLLILITASRRAAGSCSRFVPAPAGAPRCKSCHAWRSRRRLPRGECSRSRTCRSIASTS